MRPTYFALPLLLTLLPLQATTIATFSNSFRMLSAGGDSVEDTIVYNIAGELTFDADSLVEGGGWYNNEDAFLYVPQNLEIRVFNELESFEQSWSRQDLLAHPLAIGGQTPGFNFEYFGLFGENPVVDVVYGFPLPDGLGGFPDSATLVLFESTGLTFDSSIINPKQSLMDLQFFNTLDTEGISLTGGSYHELVDLEDPNVPELIFSASPLTTFTLVPEPSTLVLLSALIPFLGVRRRR